MTVCNRMSIARCQCAEEQTIYGVSMAEKNYIQFGQDLVAINAMLTDFTTGGTVEKDVSLPVSLDRRARLCMFRIFGIPQSASVSSLTIKMHVKFSWNLSEIGIGEDDDPGFEWLTASDDFAEYLINFNTEIEVPVSDFIDAISWDPMPLVPDDDYPTDSGYGPIESPNLVSHWNHHKNRSGNDPDDGFILILRSTNTLDRSESSPYDLQEVGHHFSLMEFDHSVVFGTARQAVFVS